MPHGEADLEEVFERAFASEGVALPAETSRALAHGLVKAVEYAAAKAAESLASITRKRTVIATALVTAVVVAGLCIPVTYLITNEGRVRNCHLITKVAKVERDRQAEQALETQSFQEKSKDRFGLSQDEFAKRIAKSEAREAQRLAVYEEVANASC